MNPVNCVLIICLTIIGSTKAGYEWSKWTDCTLGCGHGERSRMCTETPTPSIFVETCAPPKVAEIETCRKDHCPGGSTSSTTISKEITVDTVDTVITTVNTWSKEVQNCNCGCKLTDERGTVRAVISKKKDILCTWKIETKDNHFIDINFDKLDNFDWRNGGVYIAGPLLFEQLRNKNGADKFRSGLSYKSKNSLNFTLQSTQSQDSFEHVIFVFSYFTYPDFAKITIIPNVKDPNDGSNEEKKSSGMNPILIGSIAACVIVIILITLIVGYRKYQAKKAKKNGELTEEGTEDSCSSVTGSNRSARQNKLTSPRKDRMQNTVIIPQNSMQMMPSGNDSDRLLNGHQRGYPDGHEVFVQSPEPTMIMVHNGQPYINWPLQAPYLNQPHLNYPKQMSFEQITNPTNNMPLYYPTSGGEG